MKKGLAVFSGSAVVHKLLQDGTVVLGTAANPAAVTVSGNVNVTGQLTASAGNIEIGSVAGLRSTLSGALTDLSGAVAAAQVAGTAATDALSSSLKSYIDTQDQAEASARSALSSSMKSYVDGIDAAQTSANAALSSSLKTHLDAADAVLQSAIDAEKARIDTILSGADINLDQFVEVVQFVNDLSGANYEALMNAVTDINNGIDAVSGALAQEITDRETAVAGVQSNLDSVSGSLAGIIQGNFDIQQTDTELLRSDIEATQASVADLSGSVSSSLAAEVAARIAGDAAVQANLDSVSGSLKDAIDAIQLGASGDTAALSSSLKAYIDAQDVADAAAWAAADASLSGTLSGALAAEALRAVTAEGVIQSNLDSVSGSIKTYVDAADGVLQSNIESASGSLKTYVDQKITDLVNGADEALDTLKEIGDRLNADSGSLATALLNQITQVQGDLDAEELRATTAEAGLQAQIDAAAFKVNGLDVFAKSGSFTIVTGSTQNLRVSQALVNSKPVVTVDLGDSVTLAGTLTANVVSASAGLSIVGGASVAGGATIAPAVGNNTALTVSSGDVVVSHGVSRVILESSADSARLTALSDATNLAAGNFDGMSFYLKGAGAGAFARPDCWYFCQGGVWFDAPFYGPNDPE
jgi:hypothetical protein